MTTLREKILVPKYVQYILLPLALVLGIWFVSIIRTIIIMFLLATIIAFVLDQPVSLLQDKVRIPAHPGGAHRLAAAARDSRRTHRA